MKKKALAAAGILFSLLLVLGFMVPGCEGGSGDGVSTDFESEGESLNFWPVQVGSYPGVTGRVHVSGDYMYVASGSTELKIYDKSDPGGAEAGVYATACPALSVFVNGGYAYVAEGACGLEILDLLDPVGPVFVDTFPAIAIDVYMGETIGTAAGSLQVLDSSSPSSLSGIVRSSDGSSCDPLGVSTGFSISTKTFIYVAKGVCGIDIFRILDNTTLTFLKTVSTYKTSIGETEEQPLVANDVFVLGRFLFVADGLGLKVFEISTSNPTYLEFAASYNSECNTTSVFVGDLTAYVGSEDCGLLVYDASGGGDPFKYLGNKCDPAVVAAAIPEVEPNDGGTFIPTLVDQVWKGTVKSGDMDAWIFMGSPGVQKVTIELLSCLGYDLNLFLYTFSGKVIPNPGWPPDEEPYDLWKAIDPMLLKYSKNYYQEIISYTMDPAETYVITVDYSDVPMATGQPYLLTIDFE